MQRPKEERSYKIMIYQQSLVIQQRTNHLAHKIVFTAQLSLTTSELFLWTSCNQIQGRINSPKDS